VTDQDASNASNASNASTDRTDRREAGKAQMRAVYGWDIDPTKPFELTTVDHLFGEVWADRPDSLSVRDLRLVLIGMAAGSGQPDVAGLQIESALNLGEIDVADLRHLIVFLAHYAGWPRAAALNSLAEQIIARHEAALRADEDDLP
jgi:4-carboxymuconolactone decarboxylase